MTREEQINNAAENYFDEVNNEDEASYSQVTDAFIEGVKWADSHPIIKKDTLKQLIEGIESGNVRTLSQYSNKPELSKAFDDGQISILKMLIEWIDYNQYSKID